MFKIIEREHKELDLKPTSEEIRAGISMFDQFGINNTIDALANGDVLKYNEILNIDYNTIFLKMKRSRVQVQFSRNYERIRQENVQKQRK